MSTQDKLLVIFLITSAMGSLTVAASIIFRPPYRAIKTGNGAFVIPEGVSQTKVRGIAGGGAGSGQTAVDGKPYPIEEFYK